MADRYTKVVLTVIAVCLVIIAARDLPLLKAASAQMQTHVIVDGVERYAFRYAFDGVDYPLPVKVKQ
jgi:hypothetical protein